MSGKNVAIVGATGLIGHELIKILLQRNFPLKNLRLFASGRSAGTIVRVGSEELEVRETNSHSLEGMDIAMLSAGPKVSKQFADPTARAGTVIIDNSSAFSMDEDVPLVVPEVNAEDISSHKGIIATPNSSTVQLVVALYPMHRVNPITRIIVDTYQSVSGTGTAAIEELSEQSRRVIEGHGVIPHVYPHQIAFNILPAIDLFLDNGYTKEEWKIVDETRRIMHSREIAVTATCARVPVLIGNCESVHVEFTKPMSTATAERILAEAPGVKLLDDPSINLYPQPWTATNTDDVYVGRLRQDVTNNRGLAMWIVTDNVRKGTALNTVQIAETMLQRGWI